MHKIPSRSLWFNKQVNTPKSSGDLDEVVLNQQYLPADAESANLIGSLALDGKHYPVIDFDFPIVAVPSSTEGHYHLYIDKGIPWTRYKTLLNALRNADLIQPNWYQSALSMCCSFVRPPWMKKGDKPEKEWEPTKAPLTKAQAEAKMKQLGCNSNWPPKGPFVNQSNWLGIDLATNKKVIEPQFYDTSSGYKWTGDLLEYFGFEQQEDGTWKKAPKKVKT